MGSITQADIIGADVDEKNTVATDEAITITLASEPSVLWGATTGTFENEPQIIISALQDTLVNVDKTTGEILPNLATSWEWLDATHCRFTLRDDVIMNDGTPLIADDVVYTVGVWTEYSANTDTGRFIAGAENTSLRNGLPASTLPWNETIITGILITQDTSKPLL